MMAGIEGIFSTIIKLKMFAVLWHVVVVVIIIGDCQGQEFSENTLTPAIMQLITDYAGWRKLDHLLIFDSHLRKDAISNNLLQLMDCLSRRGIYSSIYSTEVPIAKDMFRISRHRLGIVVLFKCNQSIDRDHILVKASSRRLFDEQYTWLLIGNGLHDPIINGRLQLQLSLSLTTDLVVATATGHYNLSSSGTSSTARNNQCPIPLPPTASVNDEYRTSGVNAYKINDTSRRGNKNYASEKRSAGTWIPSTGQQAARLTYGNSSIAYSSRDNARVEEKPYYELVQVYKIRRDDDRSFVFITLGSWGMGLRFANVKPFVPVEGRQDLLGFPLFVGYKNWSAVTESVKYQSSKGKVFETEVDDTDNLHEIMMFIATSLNATIQYVPFHAIGTEIQDGVWSDLLKAVVAEDVDFGLDKVTITYHKLDYMAFTHAIMKTSCNIYMHPSELSVSKDIYLTPFSSKLLLCVLGMATLLVLIMLLVSAVANYKARKRNEQPEDVNVSYAALWVVGILTMQGSSWIPITSSGNMILISSLMFALIIYNAYAAFITSILSVKTSDIKTLEDLFDNGYDVGYIQNSQDEIYLQRQTNELKSIYLRGYNSRVDNIDDGLLKAAKSKYALFVSTQAARRAIAVLNPYESRCQIQEFVLKSTVEDVAFPMSKSSPYHKIINLGVMRLKESGTLSKIHALMLPKMPMCSAEQSFVSAQFEDIFTAVGLLVAGIAVSTVIAIAECIIKYRTQLSISIGRKFHRFGFKVKESVRNFEL